MRRTFTFEESSMTAAWEKNPDWWKGTATERESPRFVKDHWYDFSTIGTRSGVRIETFDETIRVIERSYRKIEPVTFRWVHCDGTLPQCTWFPEELKPADWKIGKYFVFHGIVVEFDIVSQQFVTLLSLYDCW